MRDLRKAQAYEKNLQERRKQEIMKSVAEEWDSRFESTHHSVDFFGGSQTSQKQSNKLEYSQDVENALERILGKQTLDDVRREGFVLKDDKEVRSFYHLGRWRS